MFIVSRKTEEGAELDIATVGSAEAADRLVQSFQEFWAAEYAVREVKDAEGDEAMPLNFSRPCSTCGE